MTQDHKVISLEPKFLIPLQISKKCLFFVRISEWCVDEYDGVDSLMMKKNKKTIESWNRRVIG